MENIDNKKLLSETIGVLRFPLMVCVVLIHTNITNQKEHLFVDIFDSYIIETFIRIAVPLFFFISGYLFFLGVDKFGLSEYKDKLKSRATRLLVPYVLWGIFAIGVKYIFYLLGENGSEHLFDGWFKWIYYVLWQPVNYQLWFVRDLLLLVLISPIIYLLIRNLSLLFLFIIGIGLLFSYENIFTLFGLKYYMCDQNIFGVFGLDFTSLFFFSFGAWFAIFNRDFTKEFEKLTPISFILFVVCTIGKFFCKKSVFSFACWHMSNLWGIMIVVACFYSLVKNGMVKRNLVLERCSQFIYYYHVLFIMYYVVVLFHLGLFHTSNSFVYSLVYLSVPIVTILLGLGLYKVGMRFCPKIMRVILGLK